MWGDVGRSREIWGDVGRCGEISLREAIAQEVARLALTLTPNPDR